VDVTVLKCSWCGAKFACIGEAEKFFETAYIILKKIDSDLVKPKDGFVSINVPWGTVNIRAGE
jgi:hypothetical protein